MKIIHVNKFFYVYGGPDTYYFELTELLKKKGHEVVPFSMHHERNLPTEYAQFFVSKVDLNQPLRLSTLWQAFKTSLRILYSLEARDKLEKLLDATRPDIVHFEHIYHQLSPSVLLATKKYGLPSVLTLHDYKLICPNYSLLAKGKICERCQGKKFFHAILQRCVKGSLPRSLLCAIEMYIHRSLGLYENNVNVFISPSRFLKNKMIEGNLDGRRIAYLPNFVNVDRYEPAFNSQGYLLFLGRLEPIKGADLLIKAMEAASVSNGLELWIAGDGTQRASLQTYCEQQGLDNVKFLGHIRGERLRQVIRGAMFIVIPSRWYENSPMSVFEAFAFGKPVVAAGLGGLPELVKDNETGLLFEPENADDLRDKIEWLSGNPSKVREMGQEARRQVETDYSPERHYERLLRIYDEARRLNEAARR